MAQVDLFLDDEDVAAADASSNFTLEIPSDAARRGKMEDGSFKADWSQLLNILESKWYEDNTKDKQGNTYTCITAELRFQVPSDARRAAGADPNAGREFTKWIRVVPAAMKNKQHPKYKANNFALARLNGILRSIWGTTVIPHGQKTNLANFYYAANGSPAPVAGKQVVANIRQNLYDGKLQDELTDFVPLELRGK